MKIDQGDLQFELPLSLRTKLEAFRRHVWIIKIAESVLAILSLSTLCYLLVFGLDRLGETPVWLRASLLLLTVSAWCLGLPGQLYRWVWRQRQLAQLAKLLARDQPRAGDRLLGVIELVQNRTDVQASPQLCRAAIQQVAAETEFVDFLRAVPNPRHRLWTKMAAVGVVCCVAALAVPHAGLNALQRFVFPWSAIPRYTFTQLAATSVRYVVPLGERSTIIIPLEANTLRKPNSGVARVGREVELRADRVDDQYAFELPPQTEPVTLAISIGDARCQLDVVPLSRPELRKLSAKIELPDYLGYPQYERDVRSGTISVVKGSHAVFEATASRSLEEAAIDGQTQGVSVQGERLVSRKLEIVDNVAHEIVWTDIEGLAAKTPFRLQVRAVDDKPPAVQCENLPLEKVVLDEDTIAFETLTTDDYGVKTVGVEWVGIAPGESPDSARRGEFALAGGGHEDTSLAAAGTFTPKALGITRQAVELRVYAEDYLPDRARAYSPVYRMYVLDRDQHLIWLTQQLEQWERQALEVRDEEERLLDTNRDLSKLSPADLDREENRQKIARQAAAERSNANRLAALTMKGEDLVNQATRNTEFNEETLEKWATVLQVLKQLSQNNMPSVANRLSSAANAAKSGPPKIAVAPNVQDGVRGRPEEPKEENKPEAEASSDEQQKPRPSGSLQLPNTILPSAGKKQPNPPQEPSPAAGDVQLAVEEQEQLLAEFNRVMDELKRILQELQGSTFVKRLKAAADSELAIASSLHKKLDSTFGEELNELAADYQQLVAQLQTKQLDTSRDVRIIQDDLEAYFERTRLDAFQKVHKEMVESKVVRNSMQLSEAMQTNKSGSVIAQAEYWSDQFDRWAEMLVGPGCTNCSQCKGGPGDSLPPAIVLEVLRILKSEVDLRETTRVAEQQRTVVDVEEYNRLVSELQITQEGIEQRTRLVMEQLERLQADEGKDYSKALKPLRQARGAMLDAVTLLASPNTGAPTIAAETEAIEALLITKRQKPSGGGGAGASPGGGQGEGQADVPSALAGIGDQLMTEERDVYQATGSSRSNIPAEFRAGLDAYFSALDGQEGG